MANSVSAFRYYLPLDCLPLAKSEERFYSAFNTVSNNIRQIAVNTIS
jgi:hypothetical protein